MKPHIQFLNKVTGEIIFERTFNPSQLLFWNSKEKYTVLNGGFGSGKTEPLILKAIISAMTVPDNYIFMGRKTYQEVYDVLWKDFLTLCPEQFIKRMVKSPHPSVEIYVPNSNKTSTIIFRNLDKLAETEIKGLNLGEVFIDQAEDVPEEVFKGLTMRLRRKGCPHKVWMTVNPALNWIYQRAKGTRKEEGWCVIEAPSTENYHNLPKDTVEIYESYKLTDPSYYRQYVLGVWDESLMAENTVFPRDHIIKLEKGIREPIRKFEGLNVYTEYIPGHKYQMGIDCAEGGGGDNASITIADLTTLEEVAHWAGQLPPEVVAERAVDYARLYSKDDWTSCCIVPEMNAMGNTLLLKLKEAGWNNIYQREEFDNRIKQKTMKLGWRTTTQTKPLLITNFRHLVRYFPVEVHTKETMQEMRAFIWTDEAKQKGAGAQEGFHDDRIISLLLAFWEKTRRDPKGYIKKPEERKKLGGISFTPSITIKNGMVNSKDMGGVLIGMDIKKKSWKTS